MIPLTFKPFTDHKPGIILTLLKESYKGLAKIKPEYILEWEKDWIKYDREIFQYPNTVRACGFISYLGSEIVGFGSYDPRKYPIGIIGHNCILPQFRDNGFGKQQINEILKRFRKMNFTKDPALGFSSFKPFKPPHKLAKKKFSIFTPLEWTTS